MLALVLVVALSQCSKDTDCKGDRVCSAGECVSPAPLEPPVSYAEAERLESVFRLREEIGAKRLELAQASYGGPIVSVVFGALFFGAAAGLGFAFRDSPQDGFALGALGFGIVGAGLFFTGLGVVLHRAQQRSRLPAEINGLVERLRALGADD